MKSKFLAFFYRHWLILLVIAFALFLRLFYYMGVMRGDDFRYAFYAYKFFHGGLDQSTYLPGINRPGLYVPAGVFLLLFGNSEFVVTLYPLLASIISIVLVYKILLLIANKDAALVGAFLWSVFPLAIFMATQLDPEGPLVMTTLSSVFFLLKAARADRLRIAVAYYLLCLFYLAWAFLTKLSVVPILFALLLVQAWHYLPSLWGKVRAWKYSQHIALLAGLCLAGFILFVGKVSLSRQPLSISLNNMELTAYDVVPAWFLGRGNPLHQTDLGGNWASQRDFTVDPPAEPSILTNTSARVTIFDPFAIFFLVAMTHALINRDRRFYLPLIYFAALLLYLEWGPFPRHFRFPQVFTYTPLTHWVSEDNFLYIAAPMVMVISIYLSKLLKRATTFSVAIAVISVVVAALFLESTDTRQLTLRLLSAAVVLIPVSAFLSAWFLSSTGSEKAGNFRTLLIPLIGVAALLPSSHYHVWDFYKESELRQNLRAVVAYIDHDSDLPIFQGAQSARLDFYSGFQYGFPWLRQPLSYPETRMINTNRELETLGGYVLNMGCASPVEALADWPVEQFGDPSSDQCLSLSKRLPNKTAETELLDAKERALELHDAESLQTYLSVAAQANDFDEFTRALILLSTYYPDQQLIYQASRIVEETADGLPGLVTQDLLASVIVKEEIGWQLSPMLIAEAVELDEEIVLELRLSEPAQEIQTAVFDLELKPGTIYLLDAEVKTNTPIDFVRFPDQNIPDSYLDHWDEPLQWTEYSVVFVTPDWGNEEQMVTLELFRTFGDGTIWFRYLNLTEVSTGQ